MHVLVLIKKWSQWWPLWNTTLKEEGETSLIHSETQIWNEEIKKMNVSWVEPLIKAVIFLSAEISLRSVLKGSLKPFRLQTHWCIMAWRRQPRVDCIVAVEQHWTRQALGLRWSLWDPSPVCGLVSVRQSEHVWNIRNSQNKQKE